MKKSICIMVMALVALVVTSCGSSTSTVKDLEKFTEQLRTESANYDLKDWTKAEKQFQDFATKIAKYEEDFTAEEQLQVTALCAECSMMISAAAVKMTSDGLNAVGINANNLFGGLGDKDDEEDEDEDNSSSIEAEEYEITGQTIEAATGAYSALLDAYESIMNEINECHRTALFEDYRALDKIPELEKKLKDLKNQLSNVELTPGEAARFKQLGGME